MNYAVIMAGGAGTRLWPISRERLPKTALALYSNQSMFQITVKRLAPLFSPQQIIVVAGAEHAAVLAEQVPEIPAENYILEPEGRGTAPAIALAAIHLITRDPQASMAVLTADHFIGKPKIFRQALAAALTVAQSDYLVTLGITPNSPSTEYGYIEQGEHFINIDGFEVLKAKRFVEKPDLNTAQAMLEAGNYCWNSGMFIWKVSTILKAFETFMPELYQQVLALRQTIGTKAYFDTLAQVWPGIKKQTIDYGIMEKAERVAVLPVDIQWADVGNWASLRQLLPQDEHGNAIRGEAMLLDCQNNLVFADKRLIAAIGLEDLVVVDTPDALLICHKDRVQEVRQVVERLKENGRQDLI